MFKTALNYFFQVITSRSLLIILGLIIFASSIPMYLEQIFYLKNYWGFNASDHAIGEMEELLDGFGGILVAVGVFMEERETLRKMSGFEVKNVVLNDYLNEVAHHNGMGLLLMGLFIEIGTQIIEVPPRVINTNGMENGIFTICFILSSITFIILLDFLKDYIKTYFLKKYKQ